MLDKSLFGVIIVVRFQIDSTTVKNNCRDSGKFIARFENNRHIFIGEKQIVISREVAFSKIDCKFNFSFD